MMEIYVSWCPGLEKDKEAISILKKGKYISGLEVWDCDLAKEIRKAGLKVSIHNPIEKLKLDLTDEGLIDSIKKDKGLIKCLCRSDAPVVGFHVNYKIFTIYKHIKTGASLEGVDLSKKDPQTLMSIVIRNLIFLDNEINGGGRDIFSLLRKKRKNILFETRPYLDRSALGDGMEHKDLVKDLMDIEKATTIFCRPEAIKRILDDSEVLKNGRIGFLFDVSHVFSSIIRMMHDDGLKEDPELYIDQIIESSKGRIHELHLNSLTKKSADVYHDNHSELVKGEEMSDLALRIARKVLDANPQLKVIALEIDTHSDPASHAKKLVYQAELVSKELKL